MSATSTPVEVFCSYAHEDEAWLRKIETHLSLLKRQGLISLWHDRLISPGTDWARTIDTQLETASIILLLVSANFFASDYCYGVEMKRALARHAAGEARVIPILIHAVDWNSAPFAHLQPLPAGTKSLAICKDKEGALADIAAAIRRVLVEELPSLPISAPRTVLPVIWNIPYPHNPFFLGRENELAQLHHFFQTGQATALSQPLAINGLGGIGKTQLALEYAYRYSHEYQAVLWVRAESSEAFVSSYITLASLLRLPEQEAREQEVTVQAVKTWLQTHSGWLLILDNADELTLLSNFLPPIAGGHVLLTTRASASGPLAQRLEINTLLPEHGALFLLRRSGLLSPDTTLEQAPSQERELAIQMSQELGSLPLALDQAGAYLEETQTSFADYLHIYQQRRAELLNERGEFVINHPEPVTTTWLLSFEQVAKHSLAAVELLHFLAFLAPDDIPEEIITEGAKHLGKMLVSVAADAFLLDKTIKALLAYSLVKRDSKQKTLSVHRLVQAVLRDMMSAGERKQWMERAVLAVEHVLPSVEFHNWKVYDRLLVHALLCTTWIEQEQFQTPQASRLLNQAGCYLYERARYIEAEPLWQRALTIDQAQSGSLHPDVIRSLNNLASLYKDQGKYEKAALLYEQALKICEEQLGLQHPQTIVCLNNAADLYMKQEKSAEAESLLQRALTISKAQLGFSHPHTAVCLNNLATLYLGRGQFAGAEILLQQALAINEVQMDPEHPHITNCLCNLGGLYAMQRRYDEAKPLLHRALAINEKQFGPEHPETAHCLDNLAIIYLNQGKYDEAEPLLKRSLAINERQFGREDHQIVSNLCTLGMFYEVQDRYNEAKALYKRAFMICKQSLGVGHPETQKMLVHHAKLLFQDNLDEADSPNYVQKNHRIFKKSKARKRRKR